MTSTSPGSSGVTPGSLVTGIASPEEGKSSRVFSLDVLRGIALLGILIISIWSLAALPPINKFFSEPEHMAAITTCFHLYPSCLKVK